MTTVTSDNFIYERIPNATDGYSFRTKLNSEAMSYELGETCRIPIPPVAHGFMNTSNTFINVTMECVVDGTVLAGAGGGAGNLVHSWIGINAAWDRIDFIGPNGQSINMQQNQQAIFATNLLANSDYSAAFPNSITNKSAIAQSRGGTQALEGNPVEGSANAAKTKFTSTKNHYSPTLQGLLSGAKSIPLTWFDSDCYLELYITPDIKNILYNGDALGTITGIGQATFTVDLDCQIDVVTDNSLREIQQHAGFGSDSPVSWSDINQRASLHSISAAELNSTSEFLKTNVINGVRPRKLLNVIQTAFQRNATGHHDRWSCLNPYESWYLRLGVSNYPPRPMSSDAEMCAHLLECYNQNSYSTNGNRLCGGQYSGRFPTSTAAVYDVKRGAVGFDFTQYDNSADGVDATALILESLGNIKLDPNQTSASAYEIYTIRTFGVLYSVDNSGNFSISY